MGKFDDDLEMKTITPKELEATAFQPDRESPDYAQGWAACERGGTRYKPGVSVDWCYGWDECRETKLKQERRLRRKSKL